MKRKIRFSRKVGEVEDAIEIEQSDENESVVEIKPNAYTEPVKGPKGFHESFNCATILALSEIPVQLMSRKLSINRVNSGSVMFSFLSLGFFSLIFIDGYVYDTTNDAVGTPQSYLISGLFFIAIIVAMLIRMISFWASSYQGMDISHFDFVRKDGLSRLSVRVIVEPLISVIFGIAWLFYNKYAGYILISAGVCIWFRSWYEWDYLKSKFDELESKRNSNSVTIYNPVQNNS